MSVAIPSSQPPKKPFKKATRKSCLAENVRPSLKSKPSILQQLILNQDWQRVLIRANMYPSEVSEYMRLSIAGTELLLLPLHLAVAFDPPFAVVEIFLKHFVDASALPVRASDIPVSVVVRSWKPRIGHRIKTWRRTRQGAFPIMIFPEQGQSVNDEEVLLPKSRVSEDGKTEYFSTEQQLAKTPATDAAHSEDMSSEEFSLSSNGSVGAHKDVILQLSPSGKLQPTPLKQNDTHSTAGTVSVSSSPIFRVKWDLEPLFQHVFDEGGLFPLHIACLYQASDKIIEALLNAYPSAALSSVLGMLPIHWVAAGWTLPPPSKPPASSLPSPSLILPKSPKPGTIGLLQTLKRASPESLRVQSGNHGMTPIQYVEECMEDGEYKEACLELLSGSSKGVDSIGSVASILFVDSDETDQGDSKSPSPLSPSTSLDLLACINALIADQNWEQVIALVEDDPSLAEQWLYGMDEVVVEGQEQQQQQQSPVLWKRLPLHLAVLQQAPEDLVAALLDAFPQAAEMSDPSDGMLPLHHAVAATATADLSVVDLLLKACPDATMAVDVNGRCPLHVAVQAKAPYAVIEALVLHDPHSVSAYDASGQTPVGYARHLHGQDSLVTELLENVGVFRGEHVM